MEERLVVAQLTNADIVRVARVPVRLQQGASCNDLFVGYAIPRKVTHDEQSVGRRLGLKLAAIGLVVPADRAERVSCRKTMLGGVVLEGRVREPKPADAVLDELVAQIKQALIDRVEGGRQRDVPSPQFQCVGRGIGIRERRFGDGSRNDPAAARTGSRDGGVAC